MNIRSLTLGLSSANEEIKSHEVLIEKFVKAKKKIFSKSLINLRTSRVCLSPINFNYTINDPTLQSLASWTSNICRKYDMRWFCFPFDFSEHNFDANSINPILNLLQKFPDSFVNIIVANNSSINKLSILSASDLVKRLSKNSNNGFDNFRLGISSNCNANTPFFPFSYNEGNAGFSLALEVLDSFFDIIKDNNFADTTELRELLVEKLSSELREINDLCQQLEHDSGLEFYGVDASLAPFPDGRMSVARLIELINETDIGSFGTTYATSFLTNIISQSLKNTNSKIAGFNGVMFSVLEDDFLASSIRNKQLSIETLLLYSTVCGCGLDMVPIPGDTFLEEIASIILDVSSLSISLDKPLGTRLLPIPGKGINELTDFNYDFLVDTRIMEIKNRSLNFEKMAQTITNIGKANVR